MKNFNAYNPVNLHFGKGVTEKLGETVKLYGTNVLLMYGKGSVVKFGYYDQVKKQLLDSGLTLSEFSGIRPNPLSTDADRAIKQGKDTDVIVALGGGSVIDTAKAVSVGIPEQTPVWDIVTGKYTPVKAIPVIAILTVAATGTEMNPFAVLQNPDTQEKNGFGGPLMFPKHSFLDPEFTYSVPLNHTSYGIADLIAHSFENFFGEGDAPLTDRMTSAIVKEAMKFGPRVLQEPHNYENRSNIMMQAMCALNGSTAYGRVSGDWGVHGIGHILSLLYDMPHGASLSIAYPAWLKLMATRIPERIQRLSKLIFGRADVEDFIFKIEQFFVAINCPVRLSDMDIGTEEHEKILELMNTNKVSGYHHELSAEDRKQLLSFMK